MDMQNHNELHVNVCMYVRMYVVYVHVLFNIKVINYYECDLIIYVDVWLCN